MAGIRERLNTAESLLSAYANGDRQFINCELDGCSLANVNLSGATFLRCFMSFDFKGANLTGVRFEECNLKTTTFRNAILKDAVITNCSVESIDFKEANIENLKFENNYSMGVLLNQDDLNSFC